MGERLCKMKSVLVLLCAAIAATIETTAAAPRTVLITGATGHTGSLVYLSLKAQNFTVRALVRNVSKAKKLLGCGECGEKEGVYVGDITQPSTLTAAMTGVDSLVITTGPAYHCTFPKIYIGCKFYPGAEPKTIQWLGVKSQVSAFANSTGIPLADRHVLLLSNDLTTTPDNFLDKVGGGQGAFYALNGEAYTMASGLPFTILKPNGLSEGDAAKSQIVAAHDDQGWGPLDQDYEFISRADVARLLTYAVANRDKAVGQRFDVTSKKSGTVPTTDVSVVFDAMRLPWM